VLPTALRQSNIIAFYIFLILLHANHNIKSSLHTMATFSGSRTIKLWTCCRCRENGISIALGECPKCDNHSRCIDCDVKSHATSDTEIEEEDLKIARSAGRDPPSTRRRSQHSFEPESSRETGNVTFSPVRAIHTLPSGRTLSLPPMSSSRLVFSLVCMPQILIGIEQSSVGHPLLHWPSELLLLVRMTQCMC
jgi:hypothetical protein